jgi:HAD superfamily hydrolase (TIGR01509 family)
MTLKALLLGSIGVLVETSDLQRQAFNSAFANVGLDWHWDADRYRDLLAINGGKRRLRHVADETGTDLTDQQIDAIHTDKSARYQQMIDEQGLTLRPGITDLIQAARADGIAVAFVSGTSRANIDAIDSALGQASPYAAFSLITDADTVENRKPAPDVYEYVLRHFGYEPHEVVAVEDTASSMQSPLDAGVPCIGYPGAYHVGADFAGALALTTDPTEIGSIEWVRDQLARVVGA